jgi:hypothetical protein
MGVLRRVRIEQWQVALDKRHDPPKPLSTLPGGLIAASRVRFARDQLLCDNSAVSSQIDRSAKLILTEVPFGARVLGFSPVLFRKHIPAKAVSNIPCSRLRDILLDFAVG